MLAPEAMPQVPVTGAGNSYPTVSTVARTSSDRSHSGSNPATFRGTLNPRQRKTDHYFVIWTIKWARNLAAVLAAAVCVGLLLTRWHSQLDDQSSIVATREALWDFHRTISLKVITKDVPENGRGWPRSIELAWFETSGRAPVNAVLSAADGPDNASQRPWLDIAGPDEAELAHPKVRASIDGNVASFWYNPAKGIVRARVPIRITDIQTTQLYNAVNASSVASAIDGR